MMTPKTLIRIGHALYGDRYKRPLSRDLGVDHRTIERWANGVYAINDAIAAKLRRLLERRATDIGRLLKSRQLDLDDAA